MVTTYETENTSNTFSVPTDAIALDILIRGGIGEDGEDTQNFASDGSGGTESFPNEGGTGGSGGEISGIIPVDGGETLTVDIGSNGVNGGQSPLGDAGAGGAGRGDGGNGGGASGIILQSSGEEIAVAAGGGGGGGGGSENTTQPAEIFQSGGGGGGGGSRGGSGGSGEKTVIDNPGSSVGEDGSNAQNTGNGGNGGRGSLFDGGDGSDGGTSLNESYFSDFTTGTSRAGPIIQIAPIENPRGDTTTVSGNTQQTYTVPDNTIAIDIEVRGGKGDDGRGGSRRSGPNAETVSVDGGTGGGGGLIVGRLSVSPGDTFTVSGSDGSGNSPLGNGGSGSGDGGAPSGIVRDSDDEVIGLSDGGGGGGGAGSFIFAPDGRIIENGGDGGGGGARGGSRGSGSSDGGEDGTNASGSGKGGDGGDGNTGFSGGNGADGGTTVTSELTEGKDGFVTDGTTRSSPGVDITPVFELPTPPSDLKPISQTLNQVQLSWTDNSPNENQFNIYRALKGESLSQIDSVGQNVTSYTDTSAKSGKTYTYAVTYVSDTQESAFSNSATIEVYTPPPPSNISVVDDSVNQVQITWADTSGEDSYNIYRGSSEGIDTTTVYDSVSADVTSYTDTDVSGGDEYSYGVSSVQSGVEGDLSQTATVSVGPPFDFTVTFTKTKRVSLNPTLTVDVTHYDGDRIGVNFYEDQTDKLIGTSIVFGSGTASTKWDGLDSGTSHTWYAVIYDGESSMESQRFQFETNARPNVVSKSETPVDNATSVELNPELSVDVTDGDGDVLDVHFFDSDTETQIGSTQTVNGTGTASVIWDDRQDTTEYSWYVNVSDGDLETESNEFSFSTVVEEVTGLSTKIIGNKIDIEWAGNSLNGNVSIERSSDGFQTTETILSSADGDTSSFRDVFIDTGKDYEYRVSRQGPKGRSKQSIVPGRLSKFNSIPDVGIGRNKSPEVKSIDIPRGYSSIRVYRSFLENPVFPDDYEVIEESEDSISGFIDEDVRSDTYVTYAFVGVDSQNNESPPDVRTTHVPPDDGAFINPDSS